MLAMLAGSYAYFAHLCYDRITCSDQQSGHRTNDHVNHARRMELLLLRSIVLQLPVQSDTM